MLCSRCSNDVQPIVAVDIDGTLGDYHGHFLEFAERYFDRPLRWDWDGSGEFSDHLGLDKSAYRECKLAYRQGGMKRVMPIYPGARELTESLSKVAEVWITTTRPWMRLDSVDPDTQEWLRRHDIRFDHLLYDEYKYERLAEIVGKNRVAAVIDDLSDKYDEADRVFGSRVPILRGTRWNHGVWADRVVASNLDAVRSFAMTRVHRWRRENE